MECYCMNFIKKLLIMTIFGLSQLCAMQIEADKKYAITCKNDEQLVLNKPQFDFLVSKSKTIKNFINDTEETDNEFDLPIDRESLVIIYTGLEIASRGQGLELYKYLTKLTSPQLISLIKTANFLDIEILLNYACKSLAVIILESPLQFFSNKDCLNSLPIELQVKVSEAMCKESGIKKSLYEWYFNKPRASIPQVLGYSTDGLRYLSFDHEEDTTILKVYNLEDNQLLCTSGPLQEKINEAYVCFSVDKSKIAVITKDSFTIRIFNINGQDLEFVHQFESLGDFGELKSSSFDPFNRYFTIAAADTIVVCDIKKKGMQINNIGADLDVFGQTTYSSNGPLIVLLDEEGQGPEILNLHTGKWSQLTQFAEYTFVGYKKNTICFCDDKDSNKVQVVLYDLQTEKKINFSIEKIYDSFNIDLSDDKSLLVIYHQNGTAIKNLVTQECTRIDCKLSPVNGFSLDSHWLLVQAVSSNSEIPFLFNTESNDSIIVKQGSFILNGLAHFENNQLNWTSFTGFDELKRSLSGLSIQQSICLVLLYKKLTIYDLDWAQTVYKSIPDQIKNALPQEIKLRFKNLLELVDSWIVGSSEPESLSGYKRKRKKPKKNKEKTNDQLSLKKQKRN